MTEASGVSRHFLRALDRSIAGTTPFGHWLLQDMLPEETCRQIDALPFEPPPIDDTLGKRETHNSTRSFFSADRRARFAVCRDVAEALQSPEVVREVEQRCGIALGGNYLRIEYCLDTDGFWLEPHTDIGAKLFTMLIYLSEEPGSEAWGTDLLDADLKIVATAPYRRNAGFIFIPGSNTWHGFHRRAIAGVRRSLIVNYVKPEWRSRHELAYPETPVG
jgi:hypothetical protein